MRNARRVLQSVIVILFFGTLTVFGPVAGAQQRGGAAAAGKTAGETGKNIQVLKDLPADQLNPTMRFFAYSLGVECAFCHALPDQSSDAKPTKTVARAMIKMVMEINKNSFNGRTDVTCFTCHRGTQDPTVAPVIESTKIIPGGSAPVAAPAAGRGGGRGGAAAAETAEAALPTPAAIVAKYVQALGGEQALRKIANTTVTGTFDNAGRNTQDVAWTQGTFELDEKAPNLRRLEMRSPDGKATTIGFDGTASWTQTPNGAVTEDSGMALARIRRSADLRAALDLKQQDANLQVRETQRVGDRDAYLVLAYANSDTPEQLYFDTQSGLLLRRVIVGESLVTAPPMQIDYQDYRETDGVKYAATVKISDVIATPMYTVLHVNKVDFSAPIDAAKFTKPAAAPQAGGGRGGRGGGGRGGQ
jgi:photosynthetic reaction center cytochrome c subunit